MLPLGAGPMFDMCWGLRSIVVSTSGGRCLKFFDDVDDISRQKLPERFFKLLIFLLSKDSQMFDDIGLIAEAEVSTAYER